MGLRRDIAAKNIRRFETRPQFGEKFGRCRKFVAAHGKGATIDCAGGRASDYGERVAARANPLDLPNAPENTGLISAAGAPAAHHQTERAVHFSEVLLASPRGISACHRTY